MQQHEEDIVIVGAGLAGLAVALGLHRKGVGSVVLESSPALRASGFDFATWPNAFRALDALGVGDKIRNLHVQAQALRVVSSSTGEVAREVDFSAPHGKQGGGTTEFRCVRRDVLLQVPEAELPRGTIRYSSKIVSIDQQDDAKIIHLADGSTLRAKVRNMAGAATFPASRAREPRAPSTAPASRCTRPGEDKPPAPLSRSPVPYPAPTAADSACSSARRWCSTASGSGAWSRVLSLSPGTAGSGEPSSFPEDPPLPSTSHLASFRR